VKYTSLSGDVQIAAGHSSAGQVEDYEAVSGKGRSQE
jgi:hypothetical protein